MRHVRRNFRQACPLGKWLSCPGLSDTTFVEPRKGCVMYSHAPLRPKRGDQMFSSISLTCDMHTLGCSSPFCWLLVLLNSIWPRSGWGEALTNLPAQLLSWGTCSWTLASAVSSVSPRLYRSFRYRCCLRRFLAWTTSWSVENSADIHAQGSRRGRLIFMKTLSWNLSKQNPGRNLTKPTLP